MNSVVDHIGKPFYLVDKLLAFKPSTRSQPYTLFYGTRPTERRAVHRKSFASQQYQI